MTREEILEKLVAKTITMAEADKLLDSLPSHSAPFVIKVGEKGGVSFRGVPGTHHQFGLTLYAKSVEFLFAHKAEIEKFIATNKAKLSWEKKSAA